jgi:hypothetical protein
LANRIGLSGAAASALAYIASASFHSSWEVERQN